ncbi:hypothetical protein [Pseudomonas xantholysinigenes]|uniref:Poly A polymerase head domain-containing protein n=1 Tax=Pseudomonas xantholysinigenes TaxID=2745490 RepID=A0A9E6TVC1_9PSED|nr:hypothetical protein [Pseudomonas xantholysinigenes]QXI36279.1 hypothetical protein HU772_012995 [Pseudomonas xantholysinigenes]
MINTRKKLITYLRKRDGIKPSLQATLVNIRCKLPDVVIFGGMVRDFGLGVRHFSSDIDMVTTASAEQIRHALAGLNPVMNKFGGFRFRENGRLFDIWSLQDTWAIREGHAQAKYLSDLCRTTFFNLDAVIFDVHALKVRARHGYDEDLQRRVLDINLEANPNPRQMAIRAVRMAIQKDLQLAPALVEYVLEQLYGTSLNLTYQSYVRQLHDHTGRTPESAFRFEPQLKIW